jgi:hypothetical protein
MLIALGGLSGGAKVNCVIFSNYLRLSHQKMAIFEVSILYRVPYVYIRQIRQQLEIPDEYTSRSDGNFLNLPNFANVSQKYRLKLVHLA